MRIEARDIGFSYRQGTPVLENVSFTIESGEAIALLGRNGAGKTTLFRILLNILTPSSGSLMLDKMNMSGMKRSEFAKHISYIPQISTEQFSYSVMETILMGSAPRLKLFSSPGRKEESRAYELLEMFSMKEFAKRSMDELSGGERQLVLILRALMQDARFIILDEPTASLDYGNQLLVLETLEKLKERGAGLIFSTHNPQQALMSSTRILILDDHHVGFSGTPDELAVSGELERLYGRKLEIGKIDTAEHTRYYCVPE